MLTIFDEMLQFMKTSLKAYLVMVIWVYMNPMYGLLAGFIPVYFFNLFSTVSFYASDSVFECVEIPLGFVMQLDITVHKSFFIFNMRSHTTLKYDSYVMLLILWAGALGVFCVKRCMPKLVVVYL